MERIKKEATPIIVNPFGSESLPVIVTLLAYLNQTAEFFTFPS